MYNKETVLFINTICSSNVELDTYRLKWGQLTPTSPQQKTSQYWLQEYIYVLYKAWYKVSLAIAIWVSWWLDRYSNAT